MGACSTDAQCTGFATSTLNICCSGMTGWITDLICQNADKQGQKRCILRTTYLQQRQKLSQGRSLVDSRLDALQHLHCGRNHRHHEPGVLKLEGISAARLDARQTAAIMARTAVLLRRWPHHPPTHPSPLAILVSMALWHTEARTPLQKRLNLLSFLQQTCSLTALPPQSEPSDDNRSPFASKLRPLAN